MKSIALFSAGLVAATSLFALSANAADSAVANTATPIKHLVVIFQENVSFDHYFATYPEAANPEGEPQFTAAPDTPKDVNTLKSAGLLTDNPNAANTENGADAAAPFPLDRSQAATADQEHGYGAEQGAFNDFKMDLFPKYTGKGTAGAAGSFGTKGQVMGYFDGNTVTALWNYAQNFAMSDNSFSTTFGPSTPGAINLVSGQTNGAILPKGYTLSEDGSYSKGSAIPDGVGGWTIISDLDPTGDPCSKGDTYSMYGPNIGDQLNARDITWGWFHGGFDLTATNPNGTTGCDRTTHNEVTNVTENDYLPHHQPFQYYASTANPNHTRPTSVDVIGISDDGGANHQYDLEDFYAVVKNGNIPSVSFLKAQGYQEGHAGYSDPLSEQEFIVKVVNTMMDSPAWKDTAIIVLYDDSDGWYDHAHALVNPSNAPIAGYDVLNGDRCGAGTPLPGVAGMPANGRCGHGTRQPFLVISPYAKKNFVDHTLTDQTSVIRFIQDNWLGGQRLGYGSFDAIAGSIENMFDFANGGSTPAVKLDPKTGEKM